MNNKAFTLMEVVIAMVILAGSMLVMSNSSTSSVQAIQKAEKTEQITKLLERKVIELELENEGKKFEEMKTSDSGDFGSQYPDLSWQMEIIEFPAPNLAAMALQKEGQEEMLLTILKKFSEHLQKAVREMRISVTWNVGEKQKLEYSVTTLLVDYETPIALQ